MRQSCSLRHLLGRRFSVLSKKQAYLVNNFWMYRLRVGEACFEVVKSLNLLGQCFLNFFLLAAHYISMPRHTG